MQTYVHPYWTLQPLAGSSVRCVVPHTVHTLLLTTNLSVSHLISVGGKFFGIQVASTDAGVLARVTVSVCVSVSVNGNESERNCPIDEGLCCLRCTPKKKFGEWRECIVLCVLFSRDGGGGGDVVVPILSFLENTLLSVLGARTFYCMRRSFV